MIWDSAGMGQRSICGMEYSLFGEIRDLSWSHYGSDSSVVSSEKAMSVGIESA